MSTRHPGPAMVSRSPPRFSGPASKSRWKNQVGFMNGNRFDCKGKISLRIELACMEKATLTNTERLRIAFQLFEDGMDMMKQTLRHRSGIGQVVQLVVKGTANGCARGGDPISDR